MQMDNILDNLIKQRAPIIFKQTYFSRALKKLLKKLFKYDETLETANAISSLHYSDIFTLLARKYTPNVTISGLENIPKNYPAIIVSNHPMGPADAIALASKIYQIRKDVYIFANKVFIDLVPPFKKCMAPLYWDAKKIPFPKFYFEIVTLAGSWYYGQSQYLLDEITRVTRSGGIVLLYDFNIVLNEVLSVLNTPKSESSYNHQINFSKFQSKHLQEVEMKKSSMTFSITSQELAHLILAVKSYYLFLEQKWGKQAVFSKTENNIQSYLMSTGSILTTYIYSTLYQKK